MTILMQATSLLIRFSVRGWHEGKAFTNDVILYRMILSVIFNKAKRHCKDIILHPWNDELPPIRQYENIDDIINNDTKTNYLYAPNVRRGSAIFKGEIKGGVKSSFAIRLSMANQDPINEQFIQEWNKTDEGVNNWDTQRFLIKESGKVVEITVMEVELRPIQERKMEEIGYIYGSINGQDMNEILKGMQKEVNSVLKDPVILGAHWAQPDMRPDKGQLWKDTMKHEGKERSLRTLLIQVLYANEEDVTKLRDIIGILHEKIETMTGSDCYELPKLPDGSRGLFIRAYRLTRNKWEKDNMVTMMKYHIQMKSTCSKWIWTNILDLEKNHTRI